MLYMDHCRAHSGIFLKTMSYFEINLYIHTDEVFFETKCSHTLCIDYESRLATSNENGFGVKS